MSNEMSYLAVSEATIEPHRPAPRPRLCEAFVDGDIHGRMDFKGVRERARIHDRETSSHGAGRQQRVLLDHRLFASNPTLPGASASDPLGHLFVSILLALVPSFEMKLRKKIGIWQFFSEYLQKNLEFQLKKNNNVLKFPAIFQFFLFFSFSFPGAPHKKPVR